MTANEFQNMRASYGAKKQRCTGMVRDGRNKIQASDTEILRASYGAERTHK